MAFFKNVRTWPAAVGVVVIGLLTVMLIQKNCIALSQLKSESEARPSFIEFAIKEVLVDLFLAEDAAEQISNELVRWSFKQSDAWEQAEGKIPNADCTFSEYTIIRVGDRAEPKKYMSKQDNGILLMYIDLTDGADPQKEETYLVTMSQYFAIPKKLHKGAFMLKRSTTGKCDVYAIEQH